MLFSLFSFFFIQFFHIERDVMLTFDSERRAIRKKKLNKIFEISKNNIFLNRRIFVIIHPLLHGFRNVRQVYGLRIWLQFKSNYLMNVWPLYIFY